MRREEVFWPITEGLSLVTLRRAVITICNSQVRQRQGTSVKQLSNDYTFCGVLQCILNYLMHILTTQFLLKCILYSPCPYDGCSN